jgi:predicted enzyme related to lactoylglutathione lyase
MPCPLVWFEAVGQHADKLHSFYGEVLGWRFDPERAAASRKASAAKPAPFRRAGRAALEPPPWWVTFYTRVADLDAAIETARAHGGRLLVPPTRHGDSLLAVVADPEGHPLGLCS